MNGNETKAKETGRNESVGSVRRSYTFVELKEAMRREFPVMYNGAVYDCIVEVSMKPTRRGVKLGFRDLYIEVSLRDKCGNSIMNTTPDRIVILDGLH